MFSFILLHILFLFFLCVLLWVSILRQPISLMTSHLKNKKEGSSKSSKRGILPVHYLDAKVFQDREFFKSFKKSHLNIFIKNLPKNVFALGENVLLKYLLHRWIISAEVRQHKISIPLEEFGDVLDLPCTRILFKTYKLEKSNN